MTREADEELLSAYLDGELAGNELAMVEQRLADNLAYRQLYDELRAVRTSCQALPRFSLPHDLSGEVLRRAEREMLKGSNADAAAKDPVMAVSLPMAAGDVEPVEPLRLRWPQGWRPWLWPAIALAAAILMMIMNPAAKAPRELAKQMPRTPEDIAIRSGPVDSSPQAKRESMEAGGDAVSVDRDERAEPQGEKQLSASAERKSPASSEPTDRMAKDAAPSVADQSPAAPSAAAPPAAIPAAPAAPAEAAATDLARQEAPRAAAAKARLS